MACGRDFKVPPHLPVSIDDDPGRPVDRHVLHGVGRRFFGFSDGFHRHVHQQAGLGKAVEPERFFLCRLRPEDLGFLRAGFGDSGRLESREACQDIRLDEQFGRQTGVKLPKRA